MRTSEQYLEDLRSMRPNVYMGGEIVRRDDHLIIPGINVMRITFDMAGDPENSELFTATSPYTGEKINRFCHVSASVDDLLIKQKMIRTGARLSGFCIQRCMGTDTLNALSIVTRDIDDAHGTEYYQRFLEFAKNYQKKDQIAAAVQTDAKGDRGKRPHEQVDPDMHVRVISQNKDGIIVKGAKQDITMASYCDELVVFPTRSLTSEEKQWAVAFAVPADWDRVHIVNRASAPRERKFIKAPLNTYGSSDALVIFDDTFVPWDRVFMCGEHEFGGRMALTFATCHRHSYCGCKPAVEDIIMGLIALTAEYYGVEGKPHVREKLAHLAGVAELIYAAGIAAAVESTKTASGTQFPGTIYANVGRRLAGENTYDSWGMVADIAGGFPVTMPFEEDYYHPEIGPLVNKYTVRNPAVSAENIHRLQRTLSDYLASSWAGVWQVADVHGGGSPAMETIAILGNYDFDERKRIIKRLAGIDD
ncbi:MAG: aromatic ring hydroxylase [Dehalococcoidia bacterium]|nr:MAG: aromatic ring hydroxylase [Dehalococcoidia bacterium]